MSTTPNPAASQILLTPEETSQALGTTLDELRHWRRNGTGPAFHSLGGNLVRYSAAAVAWSAASVAST
ncbi:DNA-binding protein [Cryobacterium melibiosiphilum]|uniref:DNA-binding protein n=1 Tax=Cryobacterium melibiosiphilum TaxID=995039 RepID=UPI0011C23C5B|nr:DNA-binding protein [Cryobacterium melibiosiphilum]